MVESYLIYILPVIPVLMALAGVYYTFFAKQDKAKAFLNTLFDDPDREAVMRQIEQQHFILKKRRKKDQSQWAQRLDEAMERANLLLKPNEFIGIMLGVGVLGFFLAFAMGKGPFLAVLFAVAGNLLVVAYLKVRIMLRMAKARAQFADVLDTMVNCFKSGYGFSRAIQVVAENFTDPWSTELNKVATEMNFGSTQEDALLALTKRVPNPDVALFVTAVTIQKETGGNLAELLTNLSVTIRERYKLLSKVNALSAQGKLSAVIVFLIPFGLAGIFALMMPDMMALFIKHPIGVVLIVFSCIMQLIGGVVLKKIVTLEV